MTGTDWHPSTLDEEIISTKVFWEALKDTLIDIEDAAILDAYKLPELVYQVFITQHYSSCLFDIRPVWRTIYYCQ